MTKYLTWMDCCDVVHESTIGHAEHYKTNVVLRTCVVVEIFDVEVIKGRECSTSSSIVLRDYYRLCDEVLDVDGLLRCCR